ncbi:hypothetical protein P152DRAFT_130840 [Eremomyces bilateralis CBS 781.70]|uniref:Uncharacterized protein n=1 Tax=Eremomyces bilateralis CBS 781.70 TaxID=1392243 RepID=A0A6G1GFH4_9PEZI|nr:uncharacterized protein P152DRAFT_130840 [Eremomyces bilateralis CBS 781.70]KAF1816629.1 hypothetical protein P152DRAFT_130840 [Eremomyces bilateralis CBS 781.70]
MHPARQLQRQSKVPPHPRPDRPVLSDPFNLEIRTTRHHRKPPLYPHRFPSAALDQLIVNLELVHAKGNRRSLGVPGWYATHNLPGKASCWSPSRSSTYIDIEINLPGLIVAFHASNGLPSLRSLFGLFGQQVLHHFTFHRSALRRGSTLDIPAA